MSYYFSCPDQEKRRSVKNFECECLKVSAKYWQKFPRASERELDDLNFSASERARAWQLLIFGERAS
jgi:hypothetical protein